MDLLSRAVLRQRPRVTSRVDPSMHPGAVLLHRVKVFADVLARLPSGCTAGNAAHDRDAGPRRRRRRWSCERFRIVRDPR